MTKNLLVGGLVAVGFDDSGKYMLAISHSGRGVFATATWEKVARDYTLAYPQNGWALGIGPIDGVRLRVTEKDYESGVLTCASPTGELMLRYEDGSLTITDRGLQSAS